MSVSEITSAITSDNVAELERLLPVPNMSSMSRSETSKLREVVKGIKGVVSTASPRVRLHLASVASALGEKGFEYNTIYGSTYGGPYTGTGRRRKTRKAKKTRKVKKSRKVRMAY